MALNPHAPTSSSSSSSGPLETAALVIDTGSGSTKAGFAGDDAPRGVFPTIIGKPRIPGIMVGLEEREIYAGDDAMAKRGVLALTKPINRGEVTNWEAMEMLWNHTMYTELKVPPEDHAILLSEVPMNSRACRERITKIMFEYFSVPCLYISSQAVLALYASGHTTGIVVDSGEGTSHCVPIHEGYAIPHAIQKMNFAGQDLTEYMHHLVQSRSNEKFDILDDIDKIKQLKERIAQVPLDYDVAIKEASETAGFDKTETLPDGRQVLIGIERYKIGEALFQPSTFNKEYYGIHRYANDAIKKCDEHIKEALYMNILLAGGTTMMNGFGERLKKEIKEESKKNVNYFAPPERKYSTWIGGSIIASLSTFQAMWITKSEYSEFGPEIVHRKCFQNELGD